MKWFHGALPWMLALGCGQAEENAKVLDPERDQLIQQHFDHLVGKWSALEEDPAHQFHEEWALAGNDSMTGTGFVLSGKDTVLIEHLGLHKQADDWVYTARIPSQNDGRTMAFKLTHIDRDSMCIEDTAHDFPQRITYFRSSPKVWSVSLSGRTTNGPKHSVIDLRSSKPARP